jgi:hypothetical protein
MLYYCQGLLPNFTLCKAFVACFSEVLKDLTLLLEVLVGGSQILVVLTLDPSNGYILCFRFSN